MSADIVDWQGPWKALEDGELFHTIMNNEHPACRRLLRWMSHEVLPAVDPFGYRGEPGAGSYVWPGTQIEFDAMIQDAVRAVTS